VARFGRDHGLAEVERGVPRRTVVMSGTVQSASEAFEVDLGQYETEQETYRGRAGTRSSISTRSTHCAQTVGICPGFAYPECLIQNVFRYTSSGVS
jgi:hypothetical protein